MTREKLCPAIVILGYRRPLAFKRLLNAIEAAKYHDSPNLIISLEGEADPEVVEIAENFHSDKLAVRIIRRPNRLGLREHVIACGDLTEEFGSVILLEDDILIDRFFYLYASEALSYYQYERSVAGIALYSYEYNEVAQLPFTPMFNGYDTYLMQVACSWGQCWTREQWASFKTWYSGKTQKDLERISYLPQAVKRWPETSWKKYFQGFMVESGKYFVYPYNSYSTNCSDAGGSHIKEGTTLHQVSIAAHLRPNPEYNFCPLGVQEVVYDSFMEPTGQFIFRAIAKSIEELEIDIYGTKPLDVLNIKPFAITVKHSTRKDKIFSFRFRPHEFNLMFPSDGEIGDFWLSQTGYISNARQSPFSFLIRRYSYYAKINLLSKNVLMAILISLPKKIIDKIFGNRL